MTHHGTRNNFSDWATNLATTSLASKKEESFSVSKEAVGNNRQDLSLPVLQRLMHDGYEIVQWDSGSTTHAVCLELNEQQWNLQDFISGLVHSAPIFERSHPGDVSCAVLVSGQNLPTVRVDSFGNLDEVL